MCELKTYQKAVLNFTNCHFALLEAIRLLDRKEKPKKDIKFLTLDYIQAKQILLAVKKEMGYTDGLSFLKDFNSFKGFRLVDGEVVGDICHSADIIKPWITGFPKTANNYQYETAMLILSQLR